MLKSSDSTCIFTSLRSNCPAAAKWTAIGGGNTTTGLSGVRPKPRSTSKDAGAVVGREDGASMRFCGMVKVDCLTSG